jgi:hypothetical protein
VWSVNEEKQSIGTAWHARPEYREQGGGNPECQRDQDESKCFESPAVRHRPAMANKIAIYHYVSKSREDFKAKLVRGAGLPYFERDQSWFDTIQEYAHACSLFQKCTSKQHCRNLSEASHGRHFLHYSMTS